MILWHNPNCSKSRGALELLNSKNADFKIVEYLKDIPTKEDIKNILSLLNFEDPRLMMRIKEDKYIELNLSNEEITNDMLIEAMVNNPILIERPIVINNNKATIGRPLENILEII
jgi:arsenate reductase